MIDIIKKMLEVCLAVVKEVIKMKEVVRVTPEETYKKVESGKALLVCAYDDDAKFRSLQLKGALSFSELESKLESLPKNQEIIFYCA